MCVYTSYTEYIYTSEPPCCTAYRSNTCDVCCTFRSGGHRRIENSIVALSRTLHAATACNNYSSAAFPVCTCRCAGNMLWLYRRRTCVRQPLYHIIVCRQEICIIILSIIYLYHTSGVPGCTIFRIYEDIIICNIGFLFSTTAVQEKGFP